MPNSTRTLQQVVSYAKSFPDIAPVIQQSAGGLSLQPALEIANQVMTEFCSQNFNWKWNSFLLGGNLGLGDGLSQPLTNSFQYDYAIPGLVTLGWLEYGWLLDINNTAFPQPVWPAEMVKWLPGTSMQYGMPGQFSWRYNYQMQYGVWGAPNTGPGGPNPQPNQVIGPLLGVTASPINPYLQVKDSFNNLWVLTTFGTTGSSNPFATNQNPTFPSLTDPTADSTTVDDGTCVWIAVNPAGMGIRCNPVPPQTGVVYQFNLYGQFRPLSFQSGGFTKFSQTLEPIPDDFAKYFFDGFVALAYQHSPEAAVRARAPEMYAIWMKSMQDVRMREDRERDNAGFYPATSLLQQPFTIYPGPAYPFPLPWG